MSVKLIETNNPKGKKYKFNHSEALSKSFRRKIMRSVS